MKAATGAAAGARNRVIISIHAAREGGDAAGIIIKYDFTQFQSTPPVKAATHLKIAFLRERGISIHAAREGGDYNVFQF